MLKQKLQEALKKIGLSEALADVITITDESQIEGVINSLKPTPSTELTPDFNKILGSTEFAEYVTKNGFDNVVKLSKPLQSEHDKKVTAGIKTFSDKHFKQINGENNNDMNTGADPKPNENNDVPVWAQKLIEKVDGFEKNKSTESKLEQAKSLLSASKTIPEPVQKRWVSRINLESETSFEDQVKELETEYTELHTGIVGGASGKGLPAGGQGGSEVADSEVDDVVDSII